MRLDKALANNSNYSRKDIKSFIKKGNVLVNNEVIYKEDYNVIESDIITLFNEVYDIRENIYIILNKPAGYVTANSDSLSKTVFDLINEPYKKRLCAVGRLDKDTTGLLLLTTDGGFAHYLTSPKNHVFKTYEVTLDHKLSSEDINILEDGIILDGEKLHKCEVQYVKDNIYHFIIDEGKYHQVKRMAEYVSNKVINLNRISIGTLTLSDLEIGEYRELTSIELSNLYKK